MVPQGLNPGLSAPAGDSYRLDPKSALFIWVYMLVLAVLARATGFGMGVIVALPLVLAFVRLNPYRFLVLWIAAYLFFFESSMKGTSFLFFSVADSLLIVYVTLLALFVLPETKSPRLPMSFAFLGLYLYIVLALALAPAALAEYPALNVLFDVKTTACMAFIPILLVLDGPEREPKKIFLLMGAVIAFCSLHAIMLCVQFALNGYRPVTWAGIFMVTSIFFCAEMLRMSFSKRTRRLLLLGLGLCILGVLITQTRGLWLASMVGFAYFFTNLLFRSGKSAFRILLRLVLIGIAAAILVNLSFLLVTGKSILELVIDRLNFFSAIELIDPYSSMGYRLHESWAVWDERTWFGHGPGATLNLFFTQMDKSDYLDWWSIHSGYFEILHKYGFVGLILMGWMWLGLFGAAWKVSRNGDAASRAGGMAVQLMLLNHAVYSITSNEFNRPNSPVMWLLAFYFVAKLRRPAPKGERSRSGAGPEAPKTSGDLARQGLAQQP